VRQGLAAKEYRDWMEQFFLELAGNTGAADSKALADALIVLYNGALSTATTAEPACAAAMTAKRVARLTFGSRKSLQLGLSRVKKFGLLCRAAAVRAVRPGLTAEHLSEVRQRVGMEARCNEQDGPERSDGLHGRVTTESS
jgi:hypothetical protein